MQPGTAVSLVALFFILTQIFLLYRSSLENSSHPQARAIDEHTQMLLKTCLHGRENKETHLTELRVACSQLATFDECSSRTDCFSILGTNCASKHNPVEIFLTCIPKSDLETLRARKMEVKPRVPDWMVTHPDHPKNPSVCASSRMNPGKTFRLSADLLPLDWDQKPCFACPAPVSLPDQPGPVTISAAALVYKEKDSFVNSFESWVKYGLFDYVDEVVIFINAKQDKDDPIEGYMESMRAKHKVVKQKLKIFSSPTNLGIGKALSHLMLYSKGRFVLFLEKDWELVEPYRVLHAQLEDSKKLLLSTTNGSRADVVKLRSRDNAGYPNIDPNLCIPPKWDSEEQGGEGISMWAQYRQDPNVKHESLIWWLPHLFCNIYHFMPNALEIWPNRMWACGNQEHDFLCFDSGQCGWTNNPTFFLRTWWLDTFYRISQLDDNKTFEGGTYYATEWILPHWVVAQGKGLFMHHEINEH